MDFQPSHTTPVSGRIPTGSSIQSFQLLTLGVLGKVTLPTAIIITTRDGWKPTALRTSGLGNEADGGLVGKSFKGPTHGTKIYSIQQLPHTPPKFNTSPLKHDGNGRRSGFLLGWYIFRGELTNFQGV